jgi:LmbE family N-acetylglucosaminyl deacetylase
MADIDPRTIESAVSEHILGLRPEIIVSYPVHGISGFHDHLVTHAVVKRVFCQLREDGNTWLRRFAMFTISPHQQKGFEASTIPVKSTPDQQLHVRISLTDEDNIAMDQALDCYVTYKETIEKTMKTAPPFKEIVYQLFGETPANTLSDLSENL